MLQGMQRERLLNEHKTGLSEKETKNTEILEVLVDEFICFCREVDEQTGEKYYQTGISALPHSNKQTELEVQRLNREFSDYES